MSKKRVSHYFINLLTAMSKSKYANQNDSRRVAAMLKLEETLHKVVQVMDPQKITCANADRYEACLNAMNELLDRCGQEEDTPTD